jgi:hypothetical protein
MAKYVRLCTGVKRGDPARGSKPWDITMSVIGKPIHARQ